MLLVTSTQLGLWHSSVPSTLRARDRGCSCYGTPSTLRKAVGSWGSLLGCPEEGKGALVDRPKDHWPRR